MPKPLLPLLVLLAAALAACEDAPPTSTAPPGTATAAPTATATEPPGGAGGGLEGTAVAPTPLPSPEPVPADWTTFTQPASEKSEAFTFRHPAKWLVHGEGQASPGVGLSIVMWSWQDGPPPPNSIKLDIAVIPTSIGLGYAGCEPPGNAPAALGGSSGWQTQKIYDPARSDGLTQVRQVAADREGLRYCLSAFFIEGVDDTTFVQLLSSFQFVK
jgi:hypothetical protein